MQYRFNLSVLACRLVIQTGKKCVQMTGSGLGMNKTSNLVIKLIQAGGILSQQLFPGRDAFETGAALLALITMVYIMVGGMRSVAWTDVVQGGLLVGGMLLAGLAAVAVLGGPGPFFARVSELPARSLSAPGTSGRWTPEILFTASLFASLGSMIQPAQWMRFYAARSTEVLRRSALIFAAMLN